MFNKEIIVKDRKSIYIAKSDFEKLNELKKRLYKHNISYALHYVMSKVNYNIIEYAEVEETDRQLISIEADLCKTLSLIKLEHNVKSMASVISSILKNYKEN